MEQPLVSVIMGTYNAEKTISKCIDSIIAQTYTNWEFIICNDCSTDNTLRVLNDYECIDDRIIILNNKKNSKLAASLNNCLKIARGKYVARMDADDESLPNRFQVQVKYLEEHPDIDCVGCNMIIRDDDIRKKRIRKLIEHPNKETLVYRTPFAHPTILMKKTVYDSLGGYIVSEETTRAEDLDLWIRFYSKNYKGYNLQIPLYIYHETENDFKKRTLKAAIQTSKVYLKGYKELGFPIYKYIFMFKPIVSALIPTKIIIKYKNIIDRQE